MDGLTIKDVDQCNGIVVEARSEIVSPVFTNCSVKFKDGSDYAHSEHVAWRFKSKLLFAPDTNNQNDSTRAGRIAGPSGHAQVEYLYLTNCTAEGGYYGWTHPELRRVEQHAWYVPAGQDLCCLGRALPCVRERVCWYTPGLRL